MKHIIATIIILSFLGTQNLLSVPGLDIGFRAGLSTPNDEVANVYNKNSFTDIVDGEESLYNAVYQSMSSGYHVGIELRMNMTSFFAFKGGFAWNSFPESDISIEDPNNSDNQIVLGSTTNIVPIYAGINFTILNLKFISFYATGDLAYNYVSSSIDYKVQDANIGVPISTSETDNRGGFGLGAGVDFDLKLLKINLEAKYNNVNFINKVADEPSKTFISVGLGIYFI